MRQRDDPGPAALRGPAVSRTHQSQYSIRTTSATNFALQNEQIRSGFREVPGSERSAIRDNHCESESMTEKQPGARRWESVTVSTSESRSHHSHRLHYLPSSVAVCLWHSCKSVSSVPPSSFTCRDKENKSHRKWLAWNSRRRPSESECWLNKMRFGWLQRRSEGRRRFVSTLKNVPVFANGGAGSAAGSEAAG